MVLIFASHTILAQRHEVFNGRRKGHENATGSLKAFFEQRYDLHDGGVGAMLPLLTGRRE